MHSKRHSFHMLGSSSSGNCALLHTECGPVLIDLGFSGRKLNQLLEPHGLALKDIRAIFITHEHSDHTAGMIGLRRHNPNVPIYANQQTAQALQKRLKFTPNWQLFQTGLAFQFHYINILPFPIPHDAYDPVGFTFKWADPSQPNNHYQLTWLTDLGFIPEALEPMLLEAQTLILEANYDQALLDADTIRPYSIKQRIQGRHGHLSNLDAFNLAQKLASRPCERIYLAHLSKDCNHTGVIRDLFKGINWGPHLNLSVIDPVASSCLDLRTCLPESLTLDSQMLRV